MSNLSHSLTRDARSGLGSPAVQAYRTDNVRHALHSPNLPHDELEAYLQSKAIRVNPNSLLPETVHDQDLVTFMRSAPSHHLVLELVEATQKVIRLPDERKVPVMNRFSFLPTPSTPNYSAAEVAQPEPNLTSHPHWLPFEEFAWKLVKRTKITPAVIGMALIILDRMARMIPTPSTGMVCSHHRILVAALVVSHKYLNDCTAKNIHWAHHVKIFQAPDITLMETQLNTLLDYNLRFDERELCQRLRRFLSMAGERREALCRTQQATAARQMEAARTSRLLHLRHKRSNAVFAPHYAQPTEMKPSESGRLSVPVAADDGHTRLARITLPPLSASQSVPDSMDHFESFLVAPPMDPASSGSTSSNGSSECPTPDRAHGQFTTQMVKSRRQFFNPGEDENEDDVQGRSPSPQKRMDSGLPYEAMTASTSLPAFPPYMRSRSGSTGARLISKLMRRVDRGAASIRF